MGRPALGGHAGSSQRRPEMLRSTLLDPLGPGPTSARDSSKSKSRSKSCSPSLSRRSSAMARAASRLFANTFRPLDAIPMICRRRSVVDNSRVTSPSVTIDCTIRVRLDAIRPASLDNRDASIGPNSSKTRSTRHCCSVRPVPASISRIGAMTASRARISAIGSERRVDGSAALIFGIGSTLDKSAAFL